jgi:hypothetical protein
MGDRGKRKIQRERSGPEHGNPDQDNAEKNLFQAAPVGGLADF